MFICLFIFFCAHISFPSMPERCRNHSLQRRHGRSHLSNAVRPRSGFSTRTTVIFFFFFSSSSAHFLVFQAGSGTRSALISSSWALAGIYGERKKWAYSCMLLHNSAPLANVLPCDSENRKSMGEKAFVPADHLRCSLDSLTSRWKRSQPLQRSRNSAFPSQQIEEFWSKNVSRVAQRPSQVVVFCVCFCLCAFKPMSPMCVIWQ